MDTLPVQMGDVVVQNNNSIPLFSDKAYKDGEICGLVGLYSFIPVVSPKY